MTLLHTKLVVRVIDERTPSTKDRGKLEERQTPELLLGPLSFDFHKRDFIAVHAVVMGSTDLRDEPAARQGSFFSGMTQTYTVDHTLRRSRWTPLSSGRPIPRANSRLVSSAYPTDARRQA